MSPKWRWLKDKEGKKSLKMEQKETQGPKWEPQVKQTALLASPICTGQAQSGEETKCTKKRKPRWTEVSSFGWVHPHTSRIYFPLLVKQTLSCNTGSPFQIFAVVRQNWGHYTFPQHICNLIINIFEDSIKSCSCLSLFIFFYFFFLFICSNYNFILFLKFTKLY